MQFTLPVQHFYRHPHSVHVLVVSGWRYLLDYPGNWGGGRAVEGARLLSEYSVLSTIEGSNPSLSATVDRSIVGFAIRQSTGLYCGSHHVPVAQGIERWVADPKAGGSNPPGHTRCRRAAPKGAVRLFHRYVVCFAIMRLPDKEPGNETSHSLASVIRFSLL